MYCNSLLCVFQKYVVSGTYFNNHTKVSNTIMLFYTPKTCKHYCECIISSFIFFFDSQPPFLFVLARSSSRRSVLLTSVRRGPFCFPSFGYASLLVQFSARKLRSRHFGKDYPVVEVTYLFIVVVWRLAVHRRSVYLFLSRLK